ncbi:hypothetical protein C1645_787459 [Glomus cerebriforme]|uniref:Ubiquitin-like domain-containing protein n=1 Tax=Glomus cerebriforme TaxID=658196 RepID=A0A397SG11_9GLOM|nr:hypothetical protein C1645_787459 [Glomus cerebriforme]
MSELNNSLSKELSSSNDIGGDNKVRIFIRSPTTPLPDGYSILTSIDSSVLFLKQTIFETHPLKPVVRDQKLIYRGRVLSDNDLIENVLRDGLETDQTFHLVVKPSFQTIAETTGIPISPPNPRSSPQNIRSQGYTSTSISSSQSSQQQNNSDNVQNPGYFYIPQNYAQYNPQNQQLPIINQPFQFPMGYYYVMINGLPYLMPVQYPFPYTYPYQFIQTQPQIGGQVQQQPFVAPVEEQLHDNAARNQRRATTLWLVVKLGFLVYIFSQNASAERMILLYISALVIFLYQTGRLRIVRRRRRVLVPVPNEFFVQQMPQVPPIHNQAGNQPRPDGNQPILNQNNNNSPHTPTSSSSSSSSSSSNTSSSSSNSSNNNSTSNNNTPSSSSTAEQQNNNNVNGANDIVVPQQENGRTVTLQDIEHALWTFVASLIPTNAPDVAQQEDVGI